MSSREKAVLFSSSAEHLPLLLQLLPPWPGEPGAAVAPRPGRAIGRDGVVRNRSRPGQGGCAGAGKEASGKVAGGDAGSPQEDGEELLILTASGGGI